MAIEIGSGNTRARKLAIPNPSGGKEDIARDGAQTHDDRWRTRQPLRSRACRQPGNGEGLEPEIARQHHGADDRQSEAGDTEPPCHPRLQTVHSDEGEHQHDETREKDDLGGDEERILRSLEVLTLVEGPHHGLRDEKERSRRDGQPARVSNEGHDQRRRQAMWRSNRFVDHWAVAFSFGGSAQRRSAVRLPQPRHRGAAVDELAQCRDLDQQASRWRD